MGRGTKLFQQAGSPLIQGHSKQERPPGQEYAWGAFAALLTGLVGLYALEAWHGRLASLLESAPDVLSVLLIQYAPAALVGALGGLLLGRRLGSLRPWRVAWFAGVVAGVAVIVLLKIV